MTVVVGVSPTHRTRDSCYLATMLARSERTDLLLVSVVPAPWHGRSGRVDAEYRDYLRSQAAESLDALAGIVPPDVPARTEVRESVSVSEGLVRAAQDVDASVLVLGSSAVGLIGRIGLGSVTERLLHSSPVPVAVAPQGFTASADKRITRMSIAYAVGRDETGLITAAADVAHQVGATLRLVAFAVRPPGPTGGAAGLQLEDDVAETWSDQLARARAGLLTRLSGLPEPPHQEEPVIGRGSTWARALESVPWGRGDLLVVGSSRSARSPWVFLGGTASKIARHSPVPVVVVPRGRP